MKIISTAEEISREMNLVRSASKTIAFVPTMGALHEGHLALMRAARQHGDVVVVSIFVNPKQFNDPKDFKKYTRDLEGDLKKCEGAGVDIVFTPTVEEIYPADDPSPQIPLPDVALPLEGASRPGHFEGVVAVVSRLFRLVQPDVAVFGMKDYQQVRVIEDMTRSVKLPVTIIRHPTIRERDGLAMSSRNVRLSADGRDKALYLSKALKAAEYLFAKGEKNPTAIKTKITDALVRQDITVDYVAIVDAETLQDIATIDRPAVVALAAFVDGVRLIDNCVLRPI